MSACQKPGVKMSNSCYDSRRFCDRFGYNYGMSDIISSVSICCCVSLYLLSHNTQPRIMYLFAFCTLLLHVVAVIVSYISIHVVELRVVIIIIHEFSTNGTNTIFF